MKKIIWGIIGAGILALVAWLIFKKDPDGFPLKSGSRGEDVKKLQEALNKKTAESTMAPLALDGIFGPLTEGALLHVTGKMTISKSEFSKLTKQS